MTRTSVGGLRRPLSLASLLALLTLLVTALVGGVPSSALASALPAAAGVAGSAADSYDGASQVSSGTYIAPITRVPDEVVESRSAVVLGAGLRHGAAAGFAAEDVTASSIGSELSGLEMGRNYPVALLIALSLRRFKIWPILLLSLGLSLTVETLQYTLRTWRSADVDDVICNVSGAVISYVVIAAVLHLRWPHRFPSLRRRLARPNVESAATDIAETERGATTPAGRSRS